MKPLLLLCLICICSQIEAIGQSAQYNFRQGYRFINRAERNIELGLYKRADKQLAKAKESDYGFCGNAWGEAFADIYLLESQLYIQQNQYDSALAVLDSLGGCQLGGDCEKKDSLIISILYLKFGKEKVRSAIENANTISIKQSNYFNTPYIYLPELGYNFFMYAFQEMDFDDTTSTTFTDDKIKEILFAFKHNKYIAQ